MKIKTGADTSKQARLPSAFLLMLIFFFVTSFGSFHLMTCSPQPQATATPTVVPAKTRIFSPPTQTPPPTPTTLFIADEPISYNRAFLEKLGTDPDSCLPDKTSQYIGIYIYDLDESQELVSINENVPFQFASAFKAPVLTYFLSSCQEYWNPDDPAWQANFLETAPVHESDWYQGAEYRQELTSQIYSIAGWEEIEAFSFDNRPFVAGEAGPMDKRYFILHQVYNMVTESNNVSAGNVLNFVFENCLDEKYMSDAACGGPNALTEFNAWFNDFAGIRYNRGETRRGLYFWDKLIERDAEGNLQEQQMPTTGLTDTCAMQRANLSCSSELTAVNVFSPRDFFQFYYGLYHLPKNRIRETSLEILGIQPKELSRGYLKNLANLLGFQSMSKNGRAFYSYGPIVTDAGILEYQGKSYIIVTLSFNTVESMEMLFGSYLESGLSVNDERGLIQLLLEGQLAPDGE